MERDKAGGAGRKNGHLANHHPKPFSTKLVSYKLPNGRSKSLRATRPTWSQQTHTAVQQKAEDKSTVSYVAVNRRS